MFYFILGFGIGFYSCYLALKVKKLRADKNKKSENVSDKQSTTANSDSILDFANQETEKKENK